MHKVEKETCRNLLYAFCNRQTCVLLNLFNSLIYSIFHHQMIVQSDQCLFTFYSCGVNPPAVLRSAVSSFTLKTLVSGIARLPSLENTDI